MSRPTRRQISFSFFSETRYFLMQVVLCTYIITRYTADTTTMYWLMETEECTAPTTDTFADVFALSHT